jgi:hypothetical protein
MFHRHCVQAQGLELHWFLKLSRLSLVGNAFWVDEV